LSANFTDRRLTPSEAPDATARAVDFDLLRARGLESLQASSGQRWTDHNIHDPGVTILEQLCYAMTDLLYHADTDLADLLTGEDGRIDFAKLSLHPPQVVFPCRPTTLFDYRCMLLGAVEGVDDIRLELHRPRGRAAKQRGARRQRGFAGLHYLVLRPAADQHSTCEASLREARAAYLAHRNLGEDLAQGATVIRDVPCVLHARLEISGAREPADLLAEMYVRCDDFITRRVRPQSLDGMLAEGRALEDVFEGPLSDAGCFTPDAFAAADARTLFVGDLAAALTSVEGLARVNRIALQCGGRPPVSGALRWRGREWGLRLQLPTPQDTLSTIRLHRGGREIAVAAAEVAYRVQDRLAARRMRRLPRTQWWHALEQPQGRYWPPQRYYSVQNHFPASYRLGKHGLPHSASHGERAQVQQLKGYLLLFEQVLANSQAQLEHLQSLFSAVLDCPQSYWWRMIDGESVRGVEQLYREPADAIRDAAFATFDDYLQRKHRVLDYLLALYGTTHTQDALRQFYPYLAAVELEQLLLENKAAYLRDIVRLSRDRGAGFDYGRVSWDDPDNCSGLQRRASLVLGFTHPFSRSLTAALRGRDLAVVESGALARSARNGRWMAQPGQTLLPVPAAESESAVSENEAPIAAFAGRGIDGRLLRLGLHRQRFRLAAAPGGAYYHLLLGVDDGAGWWHLGDYVSQVAAARAVDALRAALLRLNHESEGLHVVEHVLLRPVGMRAHPGVTRDFHELRLSVVFPAWSARCHRAEFRQLAQDTVELNAPAHLRVQCLWLGFDDMLAFESCYVQWLDAKLTHTQQPSQEHAASLNAAAQALIASLQHAAAEVDA
jgi:hypothetical protein